MIKTSPLSGNFRNPPVNTIEVSGWHIAGNFGNTEREQENLKKGAVLVTGHTLAKFLFLGGCSSAAEKALKGHLKLALNSIADSKMVYLD
ncbi:MAG: hypothetical protein CM1200mP30_27210 [Pseudomonadota bacterium]|nr:MAG: hypothetical protein CM1200mP30_27210 [Pseudomonadota bacterium]